MVASKLKRENSRGPLKNGEQVTSHVTPREARNRSMPLYFWIVLQTVFFDTQNPSVASTWDTFLYATHLSK